MASASRGPLLRAAALCLLLLAGEFAAPGAARAQSAGPVLDVLKAVTDNTDPDASGSISPGDVLTYTVTASNIGGVSLNNVVVSDPLTTPNATTCASLAIGASCVLAGTYTVSNADAAAGQIDNTASASSDETGPVLTSISTPVSFIPAPAMSLSKALTGNADDDGSGNVTAGDTLTYTVTASNDGNTTLTNLQIDDAQLTPAFTVCSGISPGSTCQLVGTHVVSAGEASSGSVSNTASAFSSELPSPIPSNTVTTPVVNAPGLSVAKSVANADGDGSGTVTQGDVLTYTVTATNTGNAGLTAVSVGDPLIVPSSASCATLAIGASCTLVGTYTVTAADAFNGQVSNTGNADSAETSPVSASLTTGVASAPAMNVFKTVANADGDGSGDVTQGDVLTYTVSAINTGDITLSNVNVADAMLVPDAASCASVAVGASCQLVGSYTVSAADALAGQVVNTGSATATQISGSKSATLTTPVNSAPGLSVAKSVANADNDGSGSVSQGDVLTYTVSASNIGNVTLTNVQVGDPLIAPASASCASLAAGASCDLVGSYTVGAADALAGSIDNTGTASASEIVSPVSASLSTPVAGAPAMSVAKTMANADNDGSGSVTLGDVLTYTVSASNTGNVNLANVAVGDPLITPNAINCPSLAPGASCDLVGTYTVGAGDVAAGAIDNTGTATASNLGAPVSDSLSVPVAGTPALAVAKSVVNADNDGSGDVTLGDVLTYTVRATNTGTTALTSVSVDDALITPSTTSCASLAIGAHCDLVGSYTVDAGNVAAGLVSNTGTATAKETGPVSASLATPVSGMPRLDLVKVLSNNSDADASGNVSQGDVLTYTATATNIGGGVLTNVVVTDPLTTPGTITCASVAPGASCVLSGDYTVSGADAVAGQIDNTATASSDQAASLSFSISTPVNFLAAPNMAVAKALTGNADEDGSGNVTEGDTLSYTVTASNTGNTTLTNLQIDDAQLTPAFTVCSGVSPGSSCQLVGTHVVAQGEAAAGMVSNTATAFAAELPTPSPSNTVDTPVLSGTKMTLVAALLGYTDNDGSGDISEGDQLDYDVRATNTGATTLDNVVVSSDLLQDTQPCATLAPGEQCFVSGGYTVTHADAIAGQVTNTGTATSTQVPGPLTQTVVIPISAPPTLAIVSGDGSAGYGGQSATLVVALRDIAGNPIAGATIDWTGASNASSVTGANGEASNTVSFNGVQGSLTVTATYTPAGVSVQFTLESISAALGVVSGNNQSAPIGSVLQPLVVMATDNGSPAGAPIRWTVLSGDASVAPDSPGTDGNGEASAVVTFGSTPGPVQVQAQRTDAGETAVFSLTATAALPTLTITSGDGQSGLTSTVADAPLVVTLRDGLGAPVQGETISWVASGAGSVTPGTSSTDASGQASVQLTFGASAGAITISATSAGAGQPSVSFSANAVNGVLGVASGDGQSGPVGTTLPLPLKVVVLDPSAAAAASAKSKSPGAASLGGVPVTFTVASGGGSLPQAVVMTDANGEAQTNFTLGPAPGLQTVTASIAGGSSVTFSATATLTRTLVLVSGNAQSAAPGSALPAPLVVHAQDNGADVAGADIVWHVVAGAAALAPLGPTDAGGIAQATVVLGATPGALTVRAERAEDPSVFVLFTANTAKLQLIPGLSAEQYQLAVAIDAACATLAGQTALTPAQQDFLARCQDLIDASTVDAGAATSALDALVPGLALAMEEAAFNAAQAQFQNLKARIAALRSGTQGSSFQGLALSNASGTISLGSLAQALAADQDKPAEAGGEFKRWGFFASGTIGRGEAEPGSIRPAYDYDINGLTVGVDYRFNDHFILGAALGYTHQDADLRDAPGRMDMSGYSASAYATWYRDDSWYTDAVLTWGRDSFELQRSLDYTLPLPGGASATMAQSAHSDSDGDLLDAAFTFGRDFQTGGWSIGPYGRVLYTRLDFERIVDEMAPGAGNGLGLEIDGRSLSSVASQLGAKFTYAHSTDWGVLTPHLQLEWEHEFRDDPKALVARFLADPNHTPFRLGGEDIDTDYFRMSLGLSIIMSRGRSGFLLYERTVGREGFFQDNLGLGIRIEF